MKQLACMNKVSFKSEISHENGICRLSQELAQVQASWKFIRNLFALMFNPLKPFLERSLHFSFCIIHFIHGNPLFSTHVSRCKPRCWPWGGLGSTPHPWPFDLHHFVATWKRQSLRRKRERKIVWVDMIRSFVVIFCNILSWSGFKSGEIFHTLSLPLLYQVLGLKEREGEKTLALMTLDLII